MRQLQPADITPPNININNVPQIGGDEDKKKRRSRRRKSR